MTLKIETLFVVITNFFTRIFKLEEFVSRVSATGGGLYYGDEEINNFKQIFALVSPAIDDFAEKYNFLFEKYRYGYPKWSLFFRREIGGIAQIYIDYLQGTKYEFIIGVIWSVDEFETTTRHSKYREIGRYKYTIELKPLVSLLEQALLTIKNWKLEDLDQHYSGMTVWKQHWRTKEEFEKAEHNRYPLLDKRK